MAETNWGARADTGDRKQLQPEEGGGTEERDAGCGVAGFLSQGKKGNRSKKTFSLTLVKFKKLTVPKVTCWRKDSFS